MPSQHKFVIRPLFMQLRDEIALRIVTGVWKAGSILPNEIFLAQEFNVSAGTVRKALDVLEAEKIVIRQQGRGTIVVDHDTEEMAVRFSSIFNSNEQRIAGHVSSGRAVVGVPSPVECKALRITEDEPVIKVQRTRNYHDHPFMHDEACLVIRFFPGISCEMAKSVRLTSLAQACGVQLSHAREIVEPIMCPDEMLKPLGLVTTKPILWLRRTTFSLKEDPVEYRESWCNLTDKHYMSITR